MRTETAVVIVLLAAWMATPSGLGAKIGLGRPASTGFAAGGVVAAIVCVFAIAGINQFLACRRDRRAGADA